MLLSCAKRDTPNAKDVLGKINKPVQTKTIKTGADMSSKLQTMSALVNQKLGRYKSKYQLIRDKQEFIDYVNKLQQIGIGAIDTETTSLNVFEATLAGVCLYAKGLKATYIPVNHRSHITGKRLTNQLTEQDIKEVLETVKVDWVMHNADYDIRILRHTCGLYIDCAYDTNIAGNLIDENESHKLKDLHLKYCPDEGETESLTFETLFKGVNFLDVDPEVAYLYAAGDAIKTIELMDVQLEMFKSLPDCYRVFKEIEMPIVIPVCDMEDRGVAIDFEYSKQLKEKYHKQYDELMDETARFLSSYNTIIQKYREEHEDAKISVPVNLSSPVQLAILFYDILNCPVVDKKSPRGTGEEILEEFIKKDIEVELCKKILKVRGAEKLLSTYIDKIPELAINGRVHCSFRQYGAKTGRFSSQDPNLQNIPSHNKDIRPIFCSTEGYVLISNDFSQQEPRLTAERSGDEKMQQAYRDGKDIYSSIASLAFDLPYTDCVEHNEDGTLNVEGKERRGKAKAIVLGINYGKGIPAIAEDLNISVKKAQEVFDAVLEAFPKLKDFMEESQSHARKYGYVETIWGRRRHLPDMQLDKYVITYKEAKKAENFDPLCFEENDTSFEVPKSKKQYFYKVLDSANSYKDKKAIIDAASTDGYKILENSSKIAQAERQCVNSIIQGSAADLSKLAMIAVANDKRLQELDYHLLIPVHDELIGECPIENAKEVAERVSQLMIHAGDNAISIPMKVDADVFKKNWYGEKIDI